MLQRRENISNDVMVSFCITVLRFGKLGSQSGIELEQECGGGGS